MRTVRRYLALYLLALMVAMYGCIAVQQGTVPDTPQARAAQLLAQGKKAEKYYEDVVRLFKAYYVRYQKNPTEENKRKLIEMAEIHKKAHALYEQFRAVQNTLIALLDAGGDEGEIKNLTEKGIEMLREMAVLAAIEGGE